MAMEVMRDRPQVKVMGRNLQVEVMRDRNLIILTGVGMGMKNRVLGLDITDQAIMIRDRLLDMVGVLLPPPGMVEHLPRLQLEEECPPWN